METIVVFDGQVPANRVIQSRLFKRGQSLIFDSPGLPADESIEFGLSISGFFPLVNSIKEKVLPTTFLNGNFTLQGNTSLTTYLPREISETEVDCLCYLHSPVPFDLRIYVIKSEVTQEKIFNTIKEFQLQENLSDTAQVLNEIQQNNALILLGLSLAPISAGASLAIEAPLLIGTSALTPLLSGVL